MSEKEKRKDSFVSRERKVGTEESKRVKEGEEDFLGINGVRRRLIRIFRFTLTFNRTLSSVVGRRISIQGKGNLYHIGYIH